MVLDNIPGVPNVLFPRNPEIDSPTGTLLSDWKAIIDNGSLIAKSATDTGAGGATIHTVTAGKVFYLISACVSTYTTVSPTTLTSYIFWVDGATQTIVNLPNISGVNSHSELSISFTIPIKISAGVAILASSDNNNTTAIGSIVGYEVDV